MKVMMVAAVLSTSDARADDEAPKTPLFAGPRALSVYTKEAGLEGSAARLGDGTLTACGGGFIASFYASWFSILGAGTFCPSLRDTRQTYDTRGLLRLVVPEPLLGPLFFYAGAGATVFFHQGPSEQAFHRALGPVAAVGTFGQVTERVRVRFEVRDHWLVTEAGAGMRHNVFATLSLVTLFR